MLRRESDPCGLQQVSQHACCDICLLSDGRQHTATCDSVNLTTALALAPTPPSGGNGGSNAGKSAAPNADDDWRPGWHNYSADDPAASPLLHGESPATPSVPRSAADSALSGSDPELASSSSGVSDAHRAQAVLPDSDTFARLSELMDGGAFETSQVLPQSTTPGVLRVSWFHTTRSDKPGFRLGEAEADREHQLVFPARFICPFGWSSSALLYTLEPRSAADSAISGSDPGSTSSSFGVSGDQAVTIEHLSLMGQHNDQQAILIAIGGAPMLSSTGAVAASSADPLCRWQPDGGFQRSSSLRGSPGCFGCSPPRGRCRLPLGSDETSSVFLARFSCPFGWSSFALHRRRPLATRHSCHTPEPRLMSLPSSASFRRPRLAPLPGTLGVALGHIRGKLRAADATACSSEVRVAEVPAASFEPSPASVPTGASGKRASGRFRTRKPSAGSSRAGVMSVSRALQAKRSARRVAVGVRVPLE